MPTLLEVEGTLRLRGRQRWDGGAAPAELDGTLPSEKPGQLSPWRGCISELATRLQSSTLRTAAPAGLWTGRGLSWRSFTLQQPGKRFTQNGREETLSIVLGPPAPSTDKE